MSCVLTLIRSCLDNCVGMGRPAINVQDEDGDDNDDANREAEELMFGCFDETKMSVLKQERNPRGVNLLHERPLSKELGHRGRFSFSRR